MSMDTNKKAALAGIQARAIICRAEKAPGNQAEGN
jgi:hypothetical protein